MTKLFDDMTFSEKLAHCKKMFCETEILADNETTLADIHDIFDYWAPWMFEQLDRLNEIEAAYKRLERP